MQTLSPPSWKNAEEGRFMGRPHAFFAALWGHEPASRLRERRHPKP